MLRGELAKACSDNVQMVEKMRYLQSYQARQAGGSDSAYQIVQVDSDGIPQPKVLLVMPAARKCLCTGLWAPCLSA